MTIHFTILGHSSAQLPLRILGLFAQRDCAVSEMSLRRDGERYRIAIAAELPWPVAMIVLEKVRALVEVEAANATSETKRAA